MQNKFRVLALTPLLIASLLWAIPASAVNPKDTRMLTNPAISQNHIAFAYGNDLWLASRDGSNPRRLTAGQGVENRPTFSPDGKWIAFDAEYEGNLDVYIVPIEGGIPKRLTWHPGADLARGFTPDGKSVLFVSQRELFTNRYSQLFAVDVASGAITKQKIPNVFKAAYSPDGKKVAYTPIADRFYQWKNYRGGTQTRIWIMDNATFEVTEIPKPTGGSNDSDPMWIGDLIYFNSDRNGEFNLYSYNPATREIKQLTTHNDFPVLNPKAGTDAIIYEMGGYLYTMTVDGKSTKLTIGIATDLLELRPRYASGDKWVRSMALSPTGVRAVFDFRGEIVTVPLKDGDARNVSNTPGAHETYPSWSPDGKWIAYFSDKTGENHLYLSSQDGKETKEIKLSGNGFYAFPEWSPDSKKICYVDNGRVIYMLDVASGNSTKIDADEVYVPGPYRYQFGDWSGDSKWMLYTKVLESNFSKVFLYNVAEKKSYPVSDGMSDAVNPTFDRDGKYLFFLASTDAGPVVNWFDQSTIDMKASYSIYMATLQKDIVSPFMKKSDEEETANDELKKADDKKKEEPKEDAPKDWKIEAQGIGLRIIDVPQKAGQYRDLSVDDKGNLLYINSEGKPTLYRFSIEDKEGKELGEMFGYTLNDKGDKILFAANGSFKSGAVSDVKGAEPVPVGKVEVRVDPIAEWMQIYNEAWGVNRDYFYDPGMHGADWPAIQKKYAAFIPDCSSRNDVNRVIQWMCSELAVGHSYSGGGDQLFETKNVAGGLLGCDFEIENNQYKFKKIYGGLNWNPTLRSPLTEPGVNISAGEFLLAVNGKEVKGTDNVYSFFENTAGKIVELTVGTKGASRVVKVVPIANEFELRNRDWVEGNLKYVTEKTNGQVAYVYVPNTAGAGHEYFKRYFFPQAKRKAIILDERFNGGGLLADYYIDILLRPYQSHWNFRYGKDLKSPSASIQGPKVMLIDETAGSGGDMLPYMFRKFEVGTMVGKRTWGGLVGILGFPELMDGGYVTSPNVAIWTTDGFIVENVGVAPDVEIEQLPKDVLAGKDPQLDKAIEIILQELKENPVVEPKRPEHPKRAR
jgi:tricorn protease